MIEAKRSRKITTPRSSLVSSSTANRSRLRLTAFLINP